MFFYPKSRKLDDGNQVRHAGDWTAYVTRLLMLKTEQSHLRHSTFVHWHFLWYDVCGACMMQI